MGQADFFKSGEFNFYCDLCGKKGKSGTAVKTWDGHYVCKSHKEIRNPQDFVRGVRETLALPWSRSTKGAVYQVASLGLIFVVPVARGATTTELTFVNNTGGAFIWIPG